MVLQGVAYLTSSDHGAQTPGHGGLATLYVARVLGVTAVGLPDAEHVWNDSGRNVLFAAALTVVVLVAVLLACSRGRWLALGIVTLAYSGAFFVLPVLIRGDQGMQLLSTWTNAGARYAVMPVLFVLASIAIMVPHARIGRLPRTGLAWFVLAQVVVVVALGFQNRNPRSAGPEWYPELVAQARSCRAHPRPSRLVVTTPGSPWGIRLSCSQLRGIGT